MQEGGPGLYNTYNKLSSDLTGYIKKSLVNLGKWAPIAGTLVKISSGGGTHVWGIGNNGNIFVCKEPCRGAGEWTHVKIPDENVLNVYDIATNKNSAFVVYETKGASPSAVAKSDADTTEPVTFKKMSNLAVICQKLGFDDGVIKNVIKDDAVTAIYLYTLQVKTDAELRIKVDSNPNFLSNIRDAVSKTRSTKTIPPYPSTIKDSIKEESVFLVLYGPAMIKDPIVTNNGNMQINAVQRSVEATNGDPINGIQYYFDNSTTKESFDRLNAPFVQTVSAPSTTTTNSTFKIGIVKIDGTGNWDIQNLPVKAKQIVIYQNKIMISSEEDNSIGECVIPCATGSWNFVPKGSDTVLNGSVNSFYAKRNVENRYFKCNSFGNCTGIKGLDGLNLTSLAVENDNNMLYGADAKNVYKCLKQECNSKKDVRKVDTRGLLTIQDKGAISANPDTQGIWLLGDTSAGHGNIYQRIDIQNTDPIIDVVDDKMQEADRVYNSLGGGEETQTYKVGSKMTRQEALSAIKTAFNISGNINKKDDELNVLRRKIETTKTESSKYTQNMRLLHILFFTLLITLGLFLFGGKFIPPEYLMIAVVAVLGCGLGMAYYFSS